MADFHVHVPVLRITPSSCAFVHNQPDFHNWPLLPCECLQQDTEDCTPKAKAFPIACGPSSGPTSNHWPSALGSCAVSPHMSLSFSLSFSFCHLSFSFCHWPAPLGCPAAIPAGCVPSCPGPTPFTVLHCRAYTHGETLRPEECMMTGRASTNASAPSFPRPLMMFLVPTTVCVFATSPCYYIGTSSCLLQPSMCTSPAPASNVTCHGS